MWTIEQANRATAVLDTALVVMLAAHGVGELLRGRTVAGAVWIVAALAIGVASFWRPRAEGVALVVGRANDERQAGVQLRTWAIVGQVYMAVFIVLATVAAVAGQDQIWLLLVGLGGLTGLVATVVLRRRT